MTSSQDPPSPRDDEGQEFHYEVDANNRLTAVSPSWLDFAAQNEAAHLSLKHRVLGRSLWSFIDGEESRRLYGLIFQRVRTSQSQVSVPFRCDSPTRRRFMELRVVPTDDDGLALTGVLRRVEDREYTPLLDARSARSSVEVAICSWCKRVETENGWLEVEDAVRELNLFRSAVLPTLEHAACPECASPWEELAP